MDFQGRAFEPCGKCILIAAAPTPPTGVLLAASGIPNSEAFQARFYNAGAVAAFVAWGDDAAAAAAAALIPTGTSQNSTPILPGTELVMTIPAGKYWSAVVGTSTASVYVQPGRGIG
jgi:hypothetical protein